MLILDVQNQQIGRPTLFYKVYFSDIPQESANIYDEESKK